MTGENAILNQILGETLKISPKLSSLEVLVQTVDKKLTNFESTYKQDIRDISDRISVLEKKTETLEKIQEAIEISKEKRVKSIKYVFENFGPKEIIKFLFLSAILFAGSFLGSEHLSKSYNPDPLKSAINIQNNIQSSKRAPNESSN